MDEKETRKFFNRHPDTVAKDLIGLYIARIQESEKGLYEIVETASHSEITIKKDNKKTHGFTYRPGEIFLYGHRTGYTLAVGTRGNTAVGIQKVNDGESLITKIVDHLDLGEEDHNLIFNDTLWIQERKLKTENWEIDNKSYKGKMTVFKKSFKLD